MDTIRQFFPELKHICRFSKEGMRVHASDIQTQTSDIRMAYNYIMNDIQVLTSDTQMIFG